MEEEAVPVRRIAVPANDDALPSGDFSVAAESSAHVMFSLISTPPYLAFAMTDVDGAGVIGGNEKEGYYIAIEPGKHWRLRLTLDPKMDWRFDKDPITFKEASEAKYFKVISQSADETVIEAHSRYDKPIPKPWPERISLFTLYVVIGQSAAKRYKIGIDPQVRNP